MTATTYQGGLEALAPHYDGFLLDLWGVIHDGYETYPGVVACLRRLQELGKPFIFVSNAPRPHQLQVQKLKELGVVQADGSFMGEVITSGDLLFQDLINPDSSLYQTRGRAFYGLGPLKEQQLLGDSAIQPVHRLEDANFVLLTAFAETPAEIQAIEAVLEKAWARRLPVVCGNPDQQAIHGKRVLFCAGYFATRYAAMGGEVLFYGKPHSPIFERALERLAEKGCKDRSRLLMVGDTLETDVVGAHGVGLDAALVLTGNVGRELKQHLSLDDRKAVLSNLARLLSPLGQGPRWVLPGLRW